MVRWEEGRGRESAFLLLHVFDLLPAPSLLSFLSPGEGGGGKIRQTERHLVSIFCLVFPLPWRRNGKAGASGRRTVGGFFRRHWYPVPVPVPVPTAATNDSLELLVLLVKKDGMGIQGLAKFNMGWEPMVRKRFAAKRKNLGKDIQGETR